MSIEHDLEFLKITHKMGKDFFGLSDEELIKIAKTNGDIHPEAIKQYLDKYEKKE